MKIEAAKQIARTEVSATADVIVVGLGGAGAAAAIGAAEAGAKVLVIERTTGGGGSTALSGGFLYLGGGTPPQKANGFVDSADNMARYIKAAQPRAKHDLVDAYCAGSLAHYEWLVSLGVPFNDRYYPGKHFHPHSDETLVGTGSEACWPFSDVAEPIPRGHKPGAGFVGTILFGKLFDRVQALGVEIVYDAAVNALLTDGNGAVVGVQYRKEGRDTAVAARKGVVLATGGCEWDRELAQAVGAKSAWPGVEPLGAPTADGAGLALGKSVGAVGISLDECIVTSPFYPPESLVKGILVNAEGRRFVAEDVYHARSTDAILNQPKGKAYLICDNLHFGYPELGKLRQEQSHQVVDAWEDFAQMESDLGMPKGALVETIENYNRYATTGVDEEFHKNPKWMAPIAEAPFAAINCSLGDAYFASLSLGGLDTNLDGQVLTADGKAIAGLYAAGQLAPTIAVEGPGYASGFLLGSGTFFGRRTGGVAAKAPSRDGTAA